MIFSKKNISCALYFVSFICRPQPIIKIFQICKVQIKGYFKRLLLVLITQFCLLDTCAGFSLHRIGHNYGIIKRSRGSDLFCFFKFKTNNVERKITQKTLRLKKKFRLLVITIQKPNVRFCLIAKVIQISLNNFESSYSDVYKRHCLTSFIKETYYAYFYFSILLKYICEKIMF